MHKLWWFIGLALWASGIWAATPPGEAALDPALVNPGHHEQPSWFKQSFLDIREDVAEAAADGKRVMLYFYQDGCPYCAKLLQENFADREIVDWENVKSPTTGEDVPCTKEMKNKLPGSVKVRIIEECDSDSITDSAGPGKKKRPNKV